MSSSDMFWTAVDISFFSYLFSFCLVACLSVAEVASFFCCAVFPFLFTPMETYIVVEHQTNYLGSTLTAPRASNCGQVDLIACTV